MSAFCLFETDRSEIALTEKKMLHNISDHTLFPFFFQICRECRLLKDGNIRIKIKKLDLPNNAEELVTWGRQQYGNITSLTELDEANTVTKRLNPGKVTYKFLV